eukprot:3666888-Amphidinium_carterae.1
MLQFKATPLHRRQMTLSIYHQTMLSGYRPCNGTWTKMATNPLVNYRSGSRYGSSSYATVCCQATRTSKHASTMTSSRYNN